MTACVNRRSSLQMHIKSAHEQTRQFLKCEGCDKLFESDKTLRRHITLVHDKQCIVCGMSFDNREELDGHRATHLAGPITCTVRGCGKVFKAISTLLSHKKTVRMLISSRAVSRALDAGARRQNVPVSSARLPQSLSARLRAATAHAGSAS
jgi:hypothetical protein